MLAGLISWQKSQEALHIARIAALLCVGTASFVAVIFVATALAPFLFPTAGHGVLRQISKREPIRIICITLPTRVDHIRGQFAALDAVAPGEFAVTLMPAVTSIDDPRVRDFSSKAAFEDTASAEKGGSGGKPYLCFLSHVVAAGIVAAENSALPSIIMEDDPMLHSDFYRVVPAVLRTPGLLVGEDVLQLGYTPRESSHPHAPQDVLLPGSITHCVVTSPGSLVIQLSDSIHNCSADAGMAFFAIGNTVEEWSWGTQGYALSSARARTCWDRRHIPVDTRRPVEDHVYFAPRVRRISPPLIMQDYSMRSHLGHDKTDSWSYRMSRDFINWSDYVRSPLTCAPVSAGAGVVTSSCLPATNVRWAVRRHTAATARGGAFKFQLFLREQPRLCLGASVSAPPAGQPVTIQPCSVDGGSADIFEASHPEALSQGGSLGSIRHAGSADLCLQVAEQGEIGPTDLPHLGAPLVLVPCSGASDQSFKFSLLVDAGDQPSAGGSGRLATAFGRTCVAACSHVAHHCQYPHFTSLLCAWGDLDGDVGAGVGEATTAVEAAEEAHRDSEGKQPCRQLPQHERLAVEEQTP